MSDLSFSQRLRKYMELRELTREQMGELLGITGSRVTQLVNNDKEQPSNTLLLALERLEREADSTRYGIQAETWAKIEPYLPLMAALIESKTKYARAPFDAIVGMYELLTHKQSTATGEIIWGRGKERNKRARPMG